MSKAGKSGCIEGGTLQHSSLSHKYMAPVVNTAQGRLVVLCTFNIAFSARTIRPVFHMSYKTFFFPVVLSAGLILSACGAQQSEQDKDYNDDPTTDSDTAANEGTDANQDLANEPTIVDDVENEGGNAAEKIPPGLSKLKRCDTPAPILHARSGLPLLQSNPEAPVSFYLDFDGGIYHSSSSGNTYFTGYNRNGSTDNFDAQEQADILASWQHVSHYFAMFDVNVTTMDSVRENSNAWGWILISEEISGGRGSTSSSAIGQNPYARSRAGSSTVRIENKDKSRRLAHELGHNLTLQHSGVWDGNDFYKWEDWKNWDYAYGPVMGGGGEGDRNGWSLGSHSKSKTNQQDTMAIIRERLMDVGGSVDGWRKDDFVDGQVYALCDDNNGGATQEGILEKPSDIDQFGFTWGGGYIQVIAQAVDVSAALLDVEVLKNGVLVGYSGDVYLGAGNYTLRVKSQGGYGEIGSYEVLVQ